MLRFGKIFLRKVEETDLVWLAYQRNTEELRRYFRQSSPLSLKNQQEWYKTFDGFAYISHDFQHLNPVGYASLSHINWAPRTAEFGIFISKDKRGMGYGKDTMEALLKHAFEDLNLNKVYSEVFANNPCLSTQFYDKLGFKREGLLREHAYKDGMYIDSVFIGILKNEWTSRRDGFNRQKALQQPQAIGPVG